MAAGVEGESEILLGNKQLLAVFAVVALLLAVAFTGGYMLGKNSSEKKAVSTGADTQTAAQAANDGSSALTPRSVSPDDTPSAAEKADSSAPSATKEDFKKPAAEPDSEPVLGSRTPPQRTPRPGETFVQVVALTRSQAAATADVLRKQHFPALIAAKPGSTTIYRVLVGPTKDAGDITAKRDALRKIGFRDVIVQHY
jgi:hypothetical protein